MFPKKYTRKGKIIIGIYLISLLTIVIISSSYVLGYVVDRSSQVVPDAKKDLETAEGPVRDELSDVANDTQNDTLNNVPSDATAQNVADESVEQEASEAIINVESTEHENGTYSAEDLKILKEAHIRIYFDFQSFEVSEESKASLESFADVIKAYPEESIVIEGHADGYPNFMNTAMEVELSSNRIKRVYAVLVAKGLDQSKFLTINAGSSNPVSVKREERQKNDYVEIYFSDYVIKNINGK